MKHPIAPLCACLFLLSGCFATEPTPYADTRIKLVPSASGNGLVALPPECGDWSQGLGDNWQNNPWPNYGCAQARNLAAQIERPEDLLSPNDLGQADGVTTAAAIDRYHAGKTKPLIDAKADAPIAVMMPTTAASPK